MSKNETVLPERLITSIDVQEVLHAGGGLLIQRRGGTTWNRFVLLDQTTGTVAIERDADGQFWRRASSALNTNTGYWMSSPNWPIGNDWSLLPPAAYLPTLWQFRLVVKRVLPAGIPGFFGVFGQSPINPPSANNFCAYGLQSINTENGGRWTVKLRTVEGGAITSFDTGVDPSATGQLFELQYRDSTSPRIALLIDGVLVDERLGLANIPLVTAAARPWTIGYEVGINPGGGGPQVDRFRNARLIVTELPGYE